MAPGRPVRVVTVLTLLAVPGALSGQSASPTRSVLNGVYTTEQAARGKAAFESTCSECHTTGDFNGELFLFAWSGQSIHILYDFIRVSMPQETPGSLSRDTYSDILAYILELNSFPPGEVELPSEDSALERILLESGSNQDP